MTAPRLTTFGESLLRLSTPVDDPIETTDGFDAYVGGAAGNVAVAAARLGVDATWVSKLPRSPLGAKVTRTYRSHGVEPVVSHDDRERARLGTYYLERGGTPRGSRIIYDRANSSFADVTFADLPRAPFEETDAVHVTGITPALSTTAADATERVLATARQAGATTVFDLNYRSTLWSPADARATLTDLLDRVDVLFVADRDARRVLGYDGEAETVASELRTDVAADLVVLTQGPKGALAVDGRGTIRQPTFETETVDPVGTGDAFVGGFLAAWLEDGALQRALEWGAATAALKRTIAGDLAIVRPDQVASLCDGADVEIDR